MQKASFCFLSLSTSMPASFSTFAAPLSLSSCTMRTLAPVPFLLGLVPVTSIMSSLHISKAVVTTGVTFLLSE